MKENRFVHPNELRTVFNHIDFIGDGVAIFNIKGNDYRLIVHIKYKWQVIFILWIGTHTEYDKLTKDQIKKMKEPNNKKEMKSKILKTEGEYEAGLDRILALGDPEPGTPAGDELELLLLLVEYYESKHFEPIPYPHPISAIEFRMEQMGYTRADLGRLLESRRPCHGNSEWTAISHHETCPVTPYGLGYSCRSAHTRI
jgi:HTH-type transcriptional regulator/antitoxin HigA